MTTKRHNLDGIFEAFGNQHRRDIIYALGLQPYSISHLAEMQHLSLPAIHKHIKILKNSGLIKTKKIGRTHVLTLNRSSLRAMQDWLMQFKAHWGSDEETLVNYADYLNRKNKGGLPLRSPTSNKNNKTKIDERDPTSLKLRGASHVAKALRDKKGGEKKK